MRRVLFVAWFFTGVLCADSSAVFNPINDLLTQIKIYVVTILGSVVALALLPYAWKHVYNVLFRVGSDEEMMESNIESRQKARERLASHGIGEKELNLSSYRKAVNAQKFRKKFRSFDEWENSADFARSHR